jgi:FHS family L-fucose permease-like MFS transporter
VSDLFKYPHFYKGVLAQFCYVGAQVGTWSYYIQYIQDYTGEHKKLAGSLLTGTLVAFAVGRFSATYLMKFVKPGKLMGIYGTANILLVLLAVIIPGWAGVWSIFLTSFFMSLMFPTIFALGIKGLGENTKLGGSLMVMAIIGGAVFTPVMGVISDQTGSMALAMIVVLICYLVVTWYAVWGAKIVTSDE